MKAFLYEGGLVRPAPEMFDKTSRTRQLLRARGVDFSNDEEVLAWIAKKDIPAGKAYVVVEQEEIPADRAQREEWKISAFASGEKSRNE